jgi:hypothetical protein
MEATDNFLTKLDDTDEVSVLAILKYINHAAYELSDNASLLFEYKGFKLPVQSGQLFQPRIVHFLGPKLCSALEQGRHVHDSVWVQLALHALILGLVAEAFNEGWCPAEVIQFSGDIRTTGKLPPTISSFSPMFDHNFPPRGSSGFCSLETVGQ